MTGPTGSQIAEEIERAQAARVARVEWWALCHGPEHAAHLNRTAADLARYVGGWARAADLLESAIPPRAVALRGIVPRSRLRRVWRWALRR